MVSISQPIHNLHKLMNVSIAVQVYDLQKLHCEHHTSLIQPLTISGGKWVKIVLAEHILVGISHYFQKKYIWTKIRKDFSKFKE